MREDFEMAHQFEAMKSVGGMDAAQTLLKANGYTLLAFGPRKVTFYKTGTKLDARDRLPPGSIITMTGAQYREFAKTLKKPNKK